MRREPRTVVIGFKASRRERDAVNDAAKSLGITTSALIRGVLVRAQLLDAAKRKGSSRDG